jgi:hypothetical protein
MNIWNLLKGVTSSQSQTRSPPVRSEQEWLQLAKQQTMHLLQKEYGLAPTFCENLSSDQDVTLAGNSTPLVFAWIKADGDEAQLIVSVTRSKVETTMATFMHREDPIFREAHDQICNELAQSISNAVYLTMIETGASPKEVCDELRAI